MTYETDPVRWTAQPDSAPESLRRPLEAAGREGPSHAQLQALSLKLAAVAAGGAAAAAAGTAHASAGSAGAWAGVSTAVSTKLVIALTVGAVALGGTAWWATRPAVIDSKTHSQVGEKPLAETPTPGRSASGSRALNDRSAASRSFGVERADRAEAPGLGETIAARPSRADEVAQPAVDNIPAPSPASVRSGAEPTGSDSAALSRKTRASAAKSPKQDRRKPLAQPASETRSAVEDQAATDVVGKTTPPSEVDLLRRARAALAASPRDAFALTQAHREYYPRGVFAQERDALAIEALMRSGDMTRARALAEEFVSTHPNSPHAHRFREAMGLH